MLHQVIETLNARVAMRPRYDNFIGGKWVAPVDGQYFDNISPITGKPVCQIARSQAADIELALDAAHKAKDAWGKMAPEKRAEALNKIADRMQENLNVLVAANAADAKKAQAIAKSNAADAQPVAGHLQDVRAPAGCVDSAFRMLRLEQTRLTGDRDAAATHSPFLAATAIRGFPGLRGVPSRLSGIRARSRLHQDGPVIRVDFRAPRHRHLDDHASRPGLSRF